MDYILGLSLCEKPAAWDVHIEAGQQSPLTYGGA